MWFSWNTSYKGKMYHSNHSSREFPCSNKIQELSNFCTNSSFIKFKEISFITFCGPFTKHVTNVEIQATNILFTKKMFVLQVFFASSSSNLSMLLALTFSSPFNHAFAIQFSFAHETRKREKLANINMWKNSKQELIVKKECSFHH